MDSLVKTYINDLRNFDNDDDACSTVKLIHDVINAEKNIDLNFKLLFNDSWGLIHYLKMLTKKQVVKEDLIKEIRTLLTCVIEYFTRPFEKYTIQVAGFCQIAIQQSINNSMKLLAYDILISLLNNHNGYFQNDLEGVMKLYKVLLHSKTLDKISSTEKKKAYSLIGAIVSFFPEIIDNKLQVQLFRHLLQKIRKQIEFEKQNSAGFKVTEMEGLIECLQSFLKSFHEEQYVKECQEMYGYIKIGCSMIKHRRTSIRAAFKIIEQNFSLFAENIYSDYFTWYELLSSYLTFSNRDDQLAAFSVFKVFYPGITKLLKKKQEQSMDEDKNILNFFMDKMRSGMEKRNNLEVALAMENFGYFGNVCKSYGKLKELQEMFIFVIQIAENYLIGESYENIDLHHLSGLLASMAKISKSLYREDLRDDFSILARFSSFVISTYPKVPSHFQFIVMNNMVKTIIVVSKTGERFLDSYLDKMMFISVIKCCSCPLKRDVDFIKTLGNVKDLNFNSSNDYTKIWKSICNIENMLSNNDIVSEKTKIDVLIRKQLPSKIFGKFISAVLIILDRLDLSVIEDNDERNMMIPINETGYRPNTESDFYIFVNLVELFSTIILDIDTDKLNKWTPVLVKTFIRLSTTCPLKSGFYKLLTVIFQKSESKCLNSKDCIDIDEVKFFLLETLNHIYQMDDTDLMACSTMILNIPDVAVEAVSNHLTPLLQVVFTLGIENLDIAVDGLHALQKWHYILPDYQFKAILEDLLPFLNSYLRSRKSVGDCESLTKYEQQLLMSAISQPRHKMYKKYRKGFRETTDCKLLEFQKDLLKFLGIIGNELCAPIYYAEKHSTNEFTEMLRFEIPFPDVKVKILLDKLLTRVIELTSHNDMKTRIAACEMLHSITVIFLGNSLNFNQKLPIGAENLFRKLINCILKLGSDNNLVIKGIFSQLSFQIARYYSSNEDRSYITDLLLEILFDSVSHENNIVLRHFSADLIKEFFNESLKNRSNDVVRSAHVLAVMKRICLFSVHPSSSKRLGAALVFNRIYREIRERESLIKIYWIELLSYFIKSLAINITKNCCDQECSLALNHIERVLIEKHTLFTKNERSRRVPKFLSAGTLQDAISWMFQFCVSENVHCRCKCMELVVHLSKKLPECDSFKIYMEKNKTEKESLLNKCLENMTFVWEAKIDKKMLSKQMKTCIAALHCFYWLLHENVIDFDKTVDKDQRFLSSLSAFCREFMVQEYADYHTHNKFNIKSMVHEIFYQYLKIFSISASIEKSVGIDSWQQKFWDKFITYLFEPPKLITSSMTESFMDVMTKVLYELKKVPATKAEFIYHRIRQHKSHELFDSFLNDMSLNEFVPLIQKQYVDALTILQNAGLIQNIFHDSIEKKQRIIANIFSFINKDGKAKIYSFPATLQLESLVAFAIQDLEITQVLNFLTDASQLHSNDSTVSHGLYFLQTFKAPIVGYLFKYQKDIIETCLAPHSLCKRKLSIIIDCLKYASELQKPLLFTELIEGIFNHWHVLVSWSAASNCSAFLLNLLDAIVNPNIELQNFNVDITSIFLWLINELPIDQASFLHRTDILRLLPTFIRNTTHENNNILKDKLKYFERTFFFISSPSKLNDSKFVNVYNELLNLFCESRNPVVFEIIMSIGATEVNEFCVVNIQRALENVMKNISDENQLELLNLSFTGENTEGLANVRLNLAQKFLIPILYLSSKNTLKLFFTSKIPEILHNMKKSINDARDQISEQEVILTKTTAVLIAEVYLDVECDEIKDAVASLNLPGISNTNSYISKIVLNIVLSQVQLKDISNEEILRKLKCYSYNTLIQIVRKVPRDSKFYANLFFEQPSKKLFIWQSIIDCNKEFNLKMTLDKLPDRNKMLKKKRKELKMKAKNTLVSSFPTQYLSTSSLLSDIKYDMSEWNISNDSSVIQLEKRTYDVNLEEDAFNDHECMTTISELIVFLVESGISPPPDIKNDPTSEPPHWMQCIRESFKNSIDRGQKNIIRYIMKLINNCENEFYPYASSWLSLIIRGLLVLAEVNYLVNDTVVTMLSWHNVAIPKDKERNNLLLNLLLENISSLNASVRNYQLLIISSVIRYWSAALDVPHTKLNLTKNMDFVHLEVVLSISKQFLIAKILPIVQQDAQKFTETLMYYLNHKTINRSLKILIFEVLALILRISNDVDLIPEYREKLQDNLIQMLNTLKISNTKMNTDLFFSCLHHTLIYFPNILNCFSSYLVQNFERYQGKIQCQFLKIIATDVKQLPENTFSQLLSQKFIHCLKENNHEILKNALLVLKLFVTTIDPNELKEIMKDILRLSTHPNIECRELVYDIADAIYLKYKNTESETSVQLLSQAKVILLNGLLDRDQNLQDKIFVLWKNRCQLNEKLLERFVCILKEMYSPQNESRFVNYTVEFLLDASSSTPDFKSKIFDNPLGSCEFKGQDFSRLVSLRSKSSVAPMFINSMSSQILEMSMKTLTSGVCLRVPGSQKRPLFEQTLNDQLLGESSITSNVGQEHQFTDFASTTKQRNYEPALKKLRVRLHSDQSKASEFHATRNIQKREKRDELIETQTERMEENVSLSRLYRDGSFPDIEIPRSAVVMPLKALARRDPVIAKLLFTSIFEGMLVEIPNRKNYLQTISDCFNQILTHSFQYDNILIETLFETSFFHPDDIVLNIQNTIIPSHAKGLCSLGSLILENSICTESRIEKMRTPKRLKTEHSNSDNLWVQLAEFYVALDKPDVVNGILKEKLVQCEAEELKKGLKYEQDGNWKSAYSLYKNKVDDIFTKNRRSCEDRFILEAYFKCAAKLSRWNELKQTIEGKFKENLNDLWNDNWNSEYVLPWFFTSETYEWAYLGVPSSYLDKMKEWMKEENAVPLMTDLVAEPLSMLLFLNGENHESRHTVNKCIETALENWNSSVPSLESFSKLQLLSEFDSMLVPYEVSLGTLSVNAIEKVLKNWKSSPPHLETYVWWDRRTVYRQRFAESYIELLAEDENDTKEQLKIFCMEAALQMVDLSLLQNNEAVACKFLLNCHDKKDEFEGRIDISALEPRLELSRSRIFLIKGQEETTSINKVKSYKKCLKSLASCEQVEQKHLYYQHLANTLRVFIEEPDLLSIEQFKFCVIQFTKTILRREDADTDTIHHIIRECIMSNYGRAAELAEINNDSSKIVEAYLSLAKFCRASITDIKCMNKNESVPLKSLLIRSILKAMKFDSKEAQLMFPVLLQVDGINSEELKSIFISESSNVEEWKFLMWIQQLLSYIDLDIFLVIEKLILRIVEKYPNAIQFSMPITMDNLNNKTEHRRKFCDKLQQILNKSCTISNLVKALSRVQVPEMRFRQFLQKISELVMNTPVNLQDVADLEKYLYTEDRFEGCLYTDCKWWNEIKNIISDVKENPSIELTIIPKIEKMLGDLANELRNINKSPDAIINKRKFLKNYSVWFENFSKMDVTNIEMPGQYSGFSCPNPEFHTKIFNFDTSVSIQQSAQLPIKMTIIGDDAKKYPYLIKFGEDLRQDTRIQQIFSIIKQCTSLENNCQRESPSVTTYGVFALTSDFGIIEWIERTIPLRDFMDYHLSEVMKKSSHLLKESLEQKYVRDLMNYYPGSSKAVSYYEEAVKKCSEIRTINMFRNLSRQIPDDVFKKSLLSLCDSPILYWHIRNQFIASYSTLCIYGWILGIGDRHLKNTLVCLKTGSCIGIDFGHAFGTGIECLPVPELIPFRMTPHIVSVMAPFYCTGLIRETMTCVLRIIYKNEDVLLAAMKIFILDPSFNWLNRTKKWIQEKECGVNPVDEMQWYPIRKMEIVKKKLRAINPVEILVEEINENKVISRSYAEACMKLLKRTTRSRNSLPKDNISLAEQIECLLDLATDECILGTSWQGLETYI